MDTDAKFHQARVEILKGLAEGEAELREGRVLSHEQAVKRMNTDFHDA